MERYLEHDGYALVPCLDELVRNWGNEELPAWAFGDESRAANVQVVRKTGEKEEGTAKTLTELEERLSVLGWDHAKKTLKDALSNHREGNWRSGNADIRPFLESIIRNVARSSPTGGTKEWRRILPHEMLRQCWEVLEADKVLNREEVNYGKAFWKTLHSEGSHPGLSTETTASFRLANTLAFARLLMRRISGAGQERN